MAYNTGSFDNFGARLHTASTTGDLSNYLIEGNGYVTEYQSEIDTYYNLFYKWSTEYVKRNYSMTSNYLPSGDWPFIN